jgi:tetratricopeptide (TPR) repeat protein
MERTVKKSHILLIYMGLALATFIAFEQVRLNDFVNYDDDKYVTENPLVKAGITRESVIQAFSRRYAAAWNPLAMLSHMLDYELFGLNPSWHHLMSLLFHVASTLLLFAVLKRMTREIWLSVFVAAVFGLHPLRVESVAWVVERKDVLCGFFWMLTMAAYVRYAERPGVLRYLLVVLGLCAGLMAKPMVVTLPFVLLLLDYWPMARFSAPQDEPTRPVYQKTTAYRLIGEKIPLIVLVAVLSIVTYIVHREGSALKGTEALSLDFRIANALVSYIKYIGKIFYPRHLAVLYPHPGENLPIWQPILCLLVVIFVSATVFYLGGKRRYLVVGWLWYLGTLVPVIGFIQTGNHAMADRFTYLPSIGIYIIVVWGVAELAVRWRYRRLVLSMAAVVLLVMMVLCTRIQVRHWRNSLTLCGHALDVTENNSVMHNNYAAALCEDGRFEEALVHFREALRISPEYFNARRNIGNLFLKEGRYDEAVANLTEALRLRKDEAEVYRNLGLAYAQLGEYDAAIQHYSEAVRISPRDLAARNNLGKLFLAQGDFREAVECFSEVLVSGGDWPDVYGNMGLAYAQLGDHQSAVKNWIEAVKLKPDSADVLNNLGWVLAVAEDAELRDPGEAVRFAKRACELTEYSRVDFLDTLGAAYAAAGSFPEAIENAEKALELAEFSGHKELMGEIRGHLDLYKAGQSYIESSSKHDSIRR